jgi:hypothetical protein
MLQSGYIYFTFLNLLYNLYISLSIWSHLCRLKVMDRLLFDGAQQPKLKANNPLFHSWLLMNSKFQISNSFLVNCNWSIELRQSVCSCDHSDALFDSLCQYMCACGTILECFMNVFACVKNPCVTWNPAGAGTGVTFHPWVWLRVGLGGCRGCGRGQVFATPAPLPSLPTKEVNQETLLCSIHYIPSVFLLLIMVSSQLN